MSKYDHLTHDELVRLLEARDRRDGTGRWMTVGYNEKTHKPRTVREFRISDAPGF